MLKIHRIRPVRRAVPFLLLGVFLLGAVAPTIAGTGIGAVFNLGKTNSVSATTTLTSGASTRTLQVTNSGSGAALQLTTKTTVAPLKVNSSIKVANLNADRLDGIDSTGFVRPSGLVLINAGFADWTPQNPSTTLDIGRNSNVATWQDSVAELVNFGAFPDLPVALYGKSLNLLGVELCYTASANAKLTSVVVDSTVTTTSAYGPTTIGLSDGTVRTDAACRLYTLPTPLALNAETTAVAFVRLQFNAGGSFNMGRTTFVLGATGTTAIAPTVAATPAP